MPDVERENRHWKRILCTCGGTLGMMNGPLLRIRHWDRDHSPAKAVYVYIDTSGEFPEVISEIPAKAGKRKETS